LAEARRQHAEPRAGLRGLHTRDIAMPLAPNQVVVIREHMQWAYGLAIFRDVLALAVFGGECALASLMVPNGENRAVMAVMLGTLLILKCNVAGGGTFACAVSDRRVAGPDGGSR
jgi:hypothetical protein